MRIGDLIEEFKELPGPGAHFPVLTLTERNGFVRQADRFNKRLAKEDTSAYKVVRRDDLAFNPYLLWAGAVAQNTICDAGIISPLYPTFRVRRGHEPRFVGRLLLTPPLVAQYDSIAFGSVPRRRRSSAADFLSLSIPEVPNAEEQRRIAIVLDAADALRAKRRQVLAKLDALTQSTFVDMFGDPVSACGLPRVPIGRLAKVITGNTPSRADPSNYGAGIEWIKSDNITKSGSIERAAETLSAAGRARGREAPAGASLVVCIAGSPRSIGRVGLLDRPVAFNQQINAVIPGERLLPEFLFHQLVVGQRLIQRASTNSMKGMVSKSALCDVEILAPPVDEQARFVAAARAILSVRTAGSASLNVLDNFFATLQQRAFRGDL